MLQFRLGLQMVYCDLMCNWACYIEYFVQFWYANENKTIKTHGQPTSSDETVKNESKENDEMHFTCLFVAVIGRALARGVPHWVFCHNFISALYWFCRRSMSRCASCSLRFLFLRKLLCLLTEIAPLRMCSAYMVTLNTHRNWQNKFERTSTIEREVNTMLKTNRNGIKNGSWALSKCVVSRSGSKKNHALEWTWTHTHKTHKRNLWCTYRPLIDCIKLWREQQKLFDEICLCGNTRRMAYRLWTSFYSELVKFHKFLSLWWRFAEI